VPEEPLVPNGAQSEPPSPPALSAWQQAFVRWKTWNDSVRKAAAALDQTVEQNRKLLARFQEFLSAAVEFDLNDAAGRWMHAATPPNWHALSFSEQSQAIDAVEESGLCTVWAPRAEIVLLLAGAGSAVERDAVLLASADQVLNDVQQVLRDVHHSQLERLVQVANEATGAYRAGYQLASQSLAAAAITSLIAEQIGEPSFELARARFDKRQPRNVGLDEFRWAAVERCLRAAITQTWKADPGFNRHGTGHGVSDSQYTPANGLAALLLLAGSLRGLQELYDALPQAATDEDDGTDT
jgi:hypothetical protein